MRINISVISVNSQVGRWPATKMAINLDTESDSLYKRRGDCVLDISDSMVLVKGGMT
jgi:hypothetical protein